jgi:integrase
VVSKQQPWLQGSKPRLCPEHVSKVICRIGKAANIVVDPKKGKHASAHDLRRSFGQRWAGRILPKDLRILMRHASITTTMTYYVAADAEETAAVLWNAYRVQAGDQQEWAKT